MDRPAGIRHRHDLGPDAAEQARHVLAGIAKPLDGDPQPLGRQAQPLGQVPGQVEAAARRGILTPDRAAQGNGLARDDGRGRLALDRGIFIGHPAHDHGIGIDVRRRDIAIRADDAGKGLDIGARQPLQLGLGQGLGVHLDRPFAPAIGQVGHRALDRHPEGQGLNLLDAGIGVEADAPLGRAARVVIAATPGQEGLARSVIHADQQAHLHGFARILQLLQHIAVDLDVARGIVEARQGSVQDVRIGHDYFNASAILQVLVAARTAPGRDTRTSLPQGSGPDQGLSAQIETKVGPARPLEPPEPAPLKPQQC